MITLRPRSTFLSAALAATLAASTTSSASAATFTGGVPTAVPVAGLWFKDATKTYKATTLVKGIANSTGVTKSGNNWIMSWQTNDPRHRVIDMTISPAVSGVQSISAQVTGLSTTPTAVGIDFSAAKGERWTGFGERADAVVRGGTSKPQQVENYVSDGPWQPSEWTGVGKALPPGGSRGRMDATYFPVPWAMSTKSYGVLLDNNETSRFSFPKSNGKTWSADVDGGSLQLRIFSAANPAALLSLYTQTTGRQPAAAAPFYFGPWLQSPGDPAAVISKLKSSGSPTSLSMTYSHYLPCGSDRGHEQAMIDRADLWHNAGMAVTTYFNPMVCNTYGEVFPDASAAGALAKKANGDTYVYRYIASSIFNVGQFDFTSSQGPTIFKGLLQRAVDHGFDGWMEDFGEYTPLDATSADGTSGPAMHNLYPRLYHKAASEFADSASRPLARFQRSGWSGTARYAQVVWGGDPSTDWGFDGLSSVVKDGLSMGMSGVSLWGSDIGGYFSISAAVPALTPELLKRWVEVGFASGVMRNETDGLAGAGKPLTRPQVTDDDVLPIWSKYSKLRTQLYPYLSAAEKQYDSTGMPIMRSLLLTNPTDTKAITKEDQYMFGPDLLVAPVLSAGATTRKAYLPAGSWIDLWRSAQLNPSTGALEPTGSTIKKGAADVTVPAPIDQLPTFVKAGAVLPLLSPDVWTLASYGNDVIHLGDREDSRRLVAFPRGSWSGALGAGEAMSSTEEANKWTLSISSSAARSYSVEAALGSLNAPFTPCTVQVNGAKLPSNAWSYNSQSKVLKLTASLTAGTIVVRSACLP